ncbi:hypothetical protein MACH15_09390 [Maricaulis maris]|nr:hypothetical protein MACH15_09390 [Maricaulis maris]
MRLRHLLQVAPSPTEVRHLPDDLEVTFAPMEALSDGLGGLDASRSRPLSEVAKGSYNYFADGDVLLAKVTPCFENGKKAVATGLANGIGFATSEVHVLRPDPERIDRSYLRYLLSSEPFRAAGMRSMTGAGGLRRVSEAAIKDFVLPTADLDTQKAIADVLDKETARIDQLIEKKQRLVELLGEREARAINDLLLGRFVNQGQTVPSGCKFLGKLPLSWKAVRLRALVSHLGNGFVGPTRDILVDPDHSDRVPYLQSTHIKWQQIDFERKPYFVTKSWLGSKPKARVEKDDLLIVQTGDCGATSIVDDQFAGSGCHALVVARPIKRAVEPRLLLRFLASQIGRAKLKAIETGALHPHLEVGFLRDVLVPLPPRDHQAALVERIDKEIDASRSVSEVTTISIDRLKEYRSALITAAVTGQIDVTRWGQTGEGDKRLDQIQEEMAG